jgi:hypothetical protein
MEDFSITTRLSHREYSNAIFIGLYRRPATIIMGILGVMILLLGLRIISFFDDISYVEIVIGLYLLLLPTIMTLRVLYLTRSNPKSLDERTYTFGEFGFKVLAPTSTSEFQWVHIIKRREIDKFLILYQSKHSGFFIDKTKLTSEQLEFIRSKVQYS